MGTQLKVATNNSALRALVIKASLKSHSAHWVKFLMGYDVALSTAKARRM